MSGWLYYQIVSTTYRLSGTLAAPPLVYEAHRAGEALMVLASIPGLLGLWARVCRFGRETGGNAAAPSGSGHDSRTIFTTLIFTGLSARPVRSGVGVSGPEGRARDRMDLSVRDGIYLLSALCVYMAGLLCWSYTVIRLLTMGRLAGYGIGFMFIAGYALLFSNLTLMVILGVMLLTLDRITAGAIAEPVAVDQAAA